MSSKNKVIPFENDDLQVEEFKQIDYNDDGGNRPNGLAKGGANYEDLVKKRDENKANHNARIENNAKEQKVLTIQTGNDPNQDRLNGGTGGQDPNISVKSQTSISTKTGGDDYLNDNVIEDVRVGNMLLNQLKINEWISNFFAMSTI